MAYCVHLEGSSAIDELDVKVEYFTCGKGIFDGTSPYDFLFQSDTVREVSASNGYIDEGVGLV